MVFKGDIVFTSKMDNFDIYDNSFLQILDGKIKGIFKNNPENTYVDYSGKLIIPTFVDLHLHGPQYANMGIGTDVELLLWLEKYTFPEECKFKDLKYAREIYKSLINDLWANGTLRSVIFASIHTEGTELLIEMIKKAGLSSYVGKVNMDRNSPESYIESTEESLRGTRYLLEKYRDGDLVKTIITPRFAPSCSSLSLRGQGELSSEFNAPVQSHINESLHEISWVKKLYPNLKNYSDVYNYFGLFGNYGKTIMAHCIHNLDDEVDLMKKRNIFLAHCPESNANIKSGIMPVKKLLARGLKISIASDISGGHSLFLPRQLVLAMEMSNLKACMEGDLSESLSLSEVFYMGTKSGGSFFGKVGSFEVGFEGDFLVIDTESLMAPNENRSTVERLQKFIYKGDNKNITNRYIRGIEIDRPF